MAGTDSYTSRGGQSNATQQRRERDQKMWNDMLKMINSTKPETMLGYGLGKLLRGAWDHRQSRKAEKATADGKGTIQAMPDNTAYTYSVGDYTVPEGAPVDTSKPSYAGIAPTQGLLGDDNMLRSFMANNPGNIIKWGQQQTKQEVKQPNGPTESVTTTSPYVISGGNTPFAQQVQQAAENLGARQTWEDILKNASYYGIR